MKLIKTIALTTLLLGFSSLASATDCTAVHNNFSNGQGLDYGNATGTNDVVSSSACHSSNAWQRLGTESTRGDNKKEENLTDNDGVSWKTSNDGGLTWVQQGELTSGGLVKFKFEVTRAITGNHKYDQLSSWVDWNHDGQWDETENIIERKWWKNQNADKTIATSGNLNTDLNSWDKLYNRSYMDGLTNTWNASTGTWSNDIYNSEDTSRNFYSGEITIPDVDTLGDIWLRARVVCENSLENHATNMKLIATGFHDQGEVEDYKLTVAIVNVPEPSTLAIFALGLLGFTARRKNINK